MTELMFPIKDNWGKAAPHRRSGDPFVECKPNKKSETKKGGPVQQLSKHSLEPKSYGFDDDSFSDFSQGSWANDILEEKQKPAPSAKKLAMARLQPKISKIDDNDIDFFSEVDTDREDIKPKSSKSNMMVNTSILQQPFALDNRGGKELLLDDNHDEAAHVDKPTRGRKARKKNAASSTQDVDDEEEEEENDAAAAPKVRRGRRSARLEKEDVKVSGKKVKPGRGESMTRSSHKDVGGISNLDSCGKKSETEKPRRTKPSKHQGGESDRPKREKKASKAAPAEGVDHVEPLPSEMNGRMSESDKPQRGAKLLRHGAGEPDPFSQAEKRAQKAPLQVTASSEHAVRAKSAGPSLFGTAVQRALDPDEQASKDRLLKKSKSSRKLLSASVHSTPGELKKIKSSRKLLSSPSVRQLYAETDGPKERAELKTLKSTRRLHATPLTESGAPSLNDSMRKSKKLVADGGTPSDIEKARLRKKQTLKEYFYEQDGTKTRRPRPSGTSSVQYVPKDVRTKRLSSALSVPGSDALPSKRKSRANRSSLFNDQGMRARKADSRLGSSKEKEKKKKSSSKSKESGDKTKESSGRHEATDSRHKVKKDPDDKHHHHKLKREPSLLSDNKEHKDKSEEKLHHHKLKKDPSLQSERKEHKEKSEDKHKEHKEKVKHKSSSRVAKP